MELLEMPKKYQSMLLAEAEKPRGEQRIKPDLFIEIYKSYSTMTRYVPEVTEEIRKSDYVEAMVEKYLDGVITNVVSFREVSKIARAERAGVDRKRAVPVLLRLVNRPKYSIHDAYRDTVQAAYEERELRSKLNSIIDKLEELPKDEPLGEDLVEVLSKLKRMINQLLRQQ